MKRPRRILAAFTGCMFAASMCPSSAAWTTYSASNSGYPSDAVESFAIDSSGAKWLGTFSSGIAELKGKQWKSYDTSDTKLTSNWIQALGTSPTGTVWAASWNLMGYGLARFDGSTWTAFHPATPGWSGGQTRAIACEANGTAWVGSTDMGVEKFDGTTWTRYDTTGGKLPCVVVNAIAIGPGNVKWFGAGDSGLVKFDGTTWTRYTTANSGLPSDTIIDNALCAQKNGTLWIGTAASVLASFNGTTWKKYDTSNGLKVYGAISCVAADSSGNIWVGAGFFLSRFDGSAWKSYSSFADAASDSFFPGTSTSAIVVDHSGGRWFLCPNEGLITDGANSAVRNFRTGAGQSVSISAVSAGRRGYTFTLTGAGSGARVDIYDVVGRRIRTLTAATGTSRDGAQRIEWDGTDAAGSKLGAGRYCARLIAGSDGPTVQSWITVAK